MILLFLGCRTFTEINPAAVTGTGYHLDRAIADIASLTVRDCESGSETVTLHERFSLLQPAPIGISDQHGCSVDLAFRNVTSGGLSLNGSLLDGEGNPLQFRYLLAPGTVTVKQEFWGDGEELVVVLDPDLLIDPAAIRQAAVEQEADTLNWDAASAESQALAGKLHSAFWIGPVSKAAPHFGARWVFGEEAFRRSARRETDGCGVEVRYDTGWDTGIYLGGTTTTGGTTGGTTSETGGTVDSDSRAESRRDSRVLDSSGSGCVCDSPPSGSHSGGTGTTTTTGTQDSVADSKGDSGGSSSSCVCGGGGGESASRARPPAALAFLGIFCFQRRKIVGGRSKRR